MGNRNIRVPWHGGRRIGGEWNKYFLKRDSRYQQIDPNLRPGRRVNAEKWFLQRFFDEENPFIDDPKKRIRVKLEVDHNHDEHVMWCSCGYRRHNKRGWVGDPRQVRRRLILQFEVRSKFVLVVICPLVVDVYEIIQTTTCG